MSLAWDCCAQALRVANLSAQNVKPPTPAMNHAALFPAHGWDGTGGWRRARLHPCWAVRLWPSYRWTPCLRSLSKPAWKLAQLRDLVLRTQQLRSSWLSLSFSSAWPAGACRWLAVVDPPIWLWCHWGMTRGVSCCECVCIGGGGEFNSPAFMAVAGSAGVGM
jgi:hypothetical protein